MASEIRRDSGLSGPAVEDVAAADDIAVALARLDLTGHRPVLVSVGGAGGMSDEHLDMLRRLLSEHVLPVLARRGATVVDGGTHSGVMRVMGEAVLAGHSLVPLVGVAAAGTARVPGRVPAREDAANLDPHHAAVLLVPGDDWGEESPWISAVAAALSGHAPTATLVVNGGGITYADAQHSVDAGRPVVVIAGTGRAADAIAAAVRGKDTDPRATEIAGSSLVHVVDIRDGDAAARLLDGLLTPT